ncbi:hypothetical protein CASFOL_000246 [Castilleja foliolosa]|uniref:Uncharacterized protein n=1 Tax=Castilleja foliolosa TaxID=1961234 RepID=A0ABD3ENS8_9LAMI
MQDNVYNNSLPGRSFLEVEGNVGSLALCFFQLVV